MTFNQAYRALIIISCILLLPYCSYAQTQKDASLSKAIQKPGPSQQMKEQYNELLARISVLEREQKDTELFIESLKNKLNQTELTIGQLSVDIKDKNIANDVRRTLKKRLKELKENSNSLKAEIHITNIKFKNISLEKEKEMKAKASMEAENTFVVPGELLPQQVDPKIIFVESIANVKQLPQGVWFGGFGRSRVDRATTWGIGDPMAPSVEVEVNLDSGDASAALKAVINKTIPEGQVLLLKGIGDFETKPMGNGKHGGIFKINALSECALISKSEMEEKGGRR